MATTRFLLTNYHSNQSPSALHLYKVGIMGEVALVEAPSAPAAALFYGLLSIGNMQLLTVVYEEDGIAYTEENAPWARYHFDASLNQQLQLELGEFLPQLADCRIISLEGLP